MSDVERSLEEEQSWVKTTMGALGRLHCGQSPPSATVNTDGDGTIYVSGPEQWDGHTIHQGKWTTAANRIAPANSIFITVKGAGVGTLFPGIEAAIGRDIYAFEPHGSIDVGFVHRALQYSIQDVIGQARGDIPGLSKSHILDHPISLPGFKTQIKVASKIDELFSRIDEGERALERVQKLVERYRQSVLKAAVTGELTREWREKQAKSGATIETGEALLARILTARREAWEQAELTKMKAKGIKPKDDKWKQKYAEPPPPDTSELPELPQGWVWASLDAMCCLITSGSRGWSQHYAETGSLFIRAQNIKHDALELNDVAFVDLTDVTEGIRTKVSLSDLLITITGANVTKTALVTSEIEDAYVSQHVALVRPVLVNTSRYLFRWIVSPANGRAALLAAAYGAGKPGLSLEDLKGLAIPLPPQGEQDVICDVLDLEFVRIQSITTDAKVRGKAVIGLRQVILKDAFAGNLISQDPHDEPASVLLERIASERANTPAKSKRGSKNKKKASK